MPFQLQRKAKYRTVKVAAEVALQDANFIMANEPFLCRRQCKTAVEPQNFKTLNSFPDKAVLFQFFFGAIRGPSFTKTSRVSG